MTDKEIDTLEAVAKKALEETEGLWDVDGVRPISKFISAASPSVILELITALRQERDNVKALESYMNAEARGY